MSRYLSVTPIDEIAKETWCEILFQAVLHLIRSRGISKEKQVSFEVKYVIGLKGIFLAILYRLNKN